MPPKLEILNNAIEKGAAILGNPEAKFNQSVKERTKRTGRQKMTRKEDVLVISHIPFRQRPLPVLLKKNHKVLKNFRGRSM